MPCIVGAPLSDGIFILFDGHGGGSVVGTTTSRAAAVAWQERDPGFHHIVHHIIQSPLALGVHEQVPTSASRRAPEDGCPVYVLHERHGDARVVGVTFSQRDAIAWCARDSNSCVVVAALLNALPQAPSASAAAPADDDGAPFTVALWVDDDGRQFNIELVGRDFVVGRDADSAIVILRDGVANHHARLYLQAGRLMLTDLGTPQGTWLNGARLQGPTLFHPGDVAVIATGVSLSPTRAPRPLAAKL